MQLLVINEIVSTVEKFKIKIKNREWTLYLIKY